MIAYIAIAIMVLFVLAIVFVGIQFFKKNKKAEHDREVHVPTTQDALPFDYIRSGIVKLKNGGYRIAVELPSINIDLMEATEKQRVLEQYREILNSVDFPFQILQQSRTVDISEYLNTLDNIRKTAKSAFIRKQIEYYSGYLVDLIKNRSILTKKFYLIIPFDEEKEKKKQKINKTKQREKLKEESNDIYQEEQRFDKARKQLYSRASMIDRAFRRFEISPSVLNDNELLDLFYNSFNKDRAVYQPLRDQNPGDYTTIRVKTTENGGVK